MKKDQKPNEGCKTLTRDELVEFLTTHEAGVKNIGNIINGVDKMLELQNDVGRPVYIVEVVPEFAGSDFFREFRKAMLGAGTACVFIPRGNLINVTANVTCDSMGVENSGVIPELAANEEQIAISAEFLQKEAKGEDE